jgi:hypothetical protein
MISILHACRPAGRTAMLLQLTLCSCALVGQPGPLSAPLPAERCQLLPALMFGSPALRMVGNVANASACCELCSADARCAAFTHHGSQPTVAPSKRSTCWLKASDSDQRRAADHATVSGCVNTCKPQPPPRPAPPPRPPPPHPSPPPPVSPPVWACAAGFDHFPFCNASLSIDQRVEDLIGRINDSAKANLLTARGGPGGMQSFPSLGVPAYYWGTNAIHGIDNGACTADGRCPTGFPSGPNVASTFNRALVQRMAAVLGTEMRALYNIGLVRGLDIWGPVVNLNRDP